MGLNNRRRSQSICESSLQKILARFFELLLKLGIHIVVCAEKGDMLLKPHAQEMQLENHFVLENVWYVNCCFSLLCYIPTAGLQHEYIDTLLL